MLDESEKKRILQEILDSPEFKDSRRYQDLLQFLVQETIAGRVPKEITIGTDFFRKGSGFDPKEDPTVRVYLNNLRKKLEHYYLTTEVPHSHKLEIPRGRYQVEFTSKELKPPEPTRRRYPVVAVSAGVLCCIIIGFLLRGLFIRSEEDGTAGNPIWAEFMKPGGRPTMIVLGDFFFLFERSADGQGGNFVRNYAINSLDDLKQLVKKDPSLSSRFVQSDITFLRPGATWGLTQILPILRKSPNGYSLKLASQFTVDDLKSNNIIFIGSVKTLYNLHKFLHVFGLEYRLSPNSFQVLGNQGDSVHVFSPTDIKGGNYEKDYAVVAKGIGPEGSTMLLLLGFAESGVIEAARSVVDDQTVTMITEKFQRSDVSRPFEFTMVVEAEGINQAIFRSHLRYFVHLHSTAMSSQVQGSDTSVGP